MPAGFAADCPETTCGFTMASPDRGEVADALQAHLEDAHGQTLPLEEVERLVIRLEPTTPGSAQARRR
jgi:predicted small metal-binding protein